MKNRSETATRSWPARITSAKTRSRNVTVSSGKDGGESLAGRRRRDEEAGPPDREAQVRRSPLVERDVDDVRARDIRSDEPPVGQGHVAEGARDPRVDERAGGEPNPLHPAAFDRNPVETRPPKAHVAEAAVAELLPSMSVSSKPPGARRPKVTRSNTFDRSSALWTVNGSRSTSTNRHSSITPRPNMPPPTVSHSSEFSMDRPRRRADLELETLREAHVLDPIAPVVAQVLGDRLGLGDGQRMTRRPFRVTHDTTIGEASASVPLGLTPRGRPGAARRSPAPRSAR